MKSLRCLCLSLLIFLFYQDGVEAVCPSNTPPSPVPLYFGFMTAVDPQSDYVLAGIIPAVDLALDLINNNTSILPGYRLTYNDTIYDSKCEHRQALNEFFDMIASRTQYIAALAAGCSAATLPVAEISHYWSLPIVSYSSAAAQLSDRTTYPSFFRTYPSDGNFVPAFVGLVRGLGWERVFIFTEESPLFTGNERSLFEELSAAGIYSQFQTFQSNNTAAGVVRNIINTNGHNGTHIFFINAYENSAIAILCQFYHLNIRYPNYAFITFGWYQTGWWDIDANPSISVPCSTQNLQTQLNRVLILQQLPLALNGSAPTISGLTADEFNIMYRNRLNDKEYISQLPPSIYNSIPDALTAFDALWSLALGLDRVQRAICDNDTLGCNGGPLTELEDFMYYNEQVECMINKSMGMTEFEGVSGYVEFDANGTRVQEVFTIFQYQMIGDSTERVLIGTLSLNDNNIRYQNNTTVWPAGIPPDGSEIKITNTIHVSLNVIFYTAAILGAVFAIGCLAFNVYFRNKKIIKLTSPNLNYTIGGGSLVMYSSIIFLLLPGRDDYSLHLRCIVGYWLAMLGYIIAFSAVLAKMWRVYYIFHNPTASKRTLRDWHLLIGVGVITLIVCLILIIGESIPETRHEPTLVVDRETGSTRNEFDVVVNYCVYSCYRSTDAVAFQALIMATLFLLQAIGIFLAFQTRKVKVKVLNDAKQVTAIIYVTSVCVVLIIMTTFALGDFLNTSSAVFSLSMTVASTAFLILIFIPKMYNLYKDPDGDDIFTGTHSSAGVPGIASGAVSILTGVQPGNSFSLRKESIGINMALATLGNDPKATIAVLEARVVELEEELRNSKMNPENPTKRGSIFPGFLSKNGTSSNHSNRNSTNNESRTSVTFEQPKDNLNSANSITSLQPSVIRESSEEIEEGIDDNDNNNVNNNGDCVKNDGENEEEGAAKTNRTGTDL